MGNALDFLNNSKDSKRAKREKYNNEAKEKIEKFKDEHGVTKLEDVELEIVGSNYKVDGVNNKFKYKKTIKSYHGRMHERKQNVKCTCCTLSFIPTKNKGLGNLNNENPYHEMCPICRGRGKEEREIIEEVGGLDNFIYLNEQVDNVHNIKEYTTLYEVYGQMDIRDKLRKKHSKTLIKMESKMINEAYNKNSKADSTIRTEEDFDF